MRRLVVSVLGLLALLAGSAHAATLEEFSDQLATAKDAGKPLSQFSVAFPEATLAQAEAVQKRYVAALLKSETLGGIKGAVVSEASQHALGIKGPLSAVLFAGGRHASADKPAVPVRAGAAPGVETEMGILIGQRIDREVADVAALKALVRAVVPVIELPAGRHDWPQKMHFTDIVAANVDADHYIVGPECPDLSLDLDAQPVQLFQNGKLVNDTVGGNARHGQWWNFLTQVNWAVRQGYTLEPGQLVITGALGKIYKADSGEFRATYGKLGEIEFSLKPSGE